MVGDNHRSKLDVTTDLQAFALIVTAEPYYAVRRPSNVVVLENVIRADTAGSIEAVDAKYELVDRGGYIPTGYKFDPVVLNAKMPLEFFEARNALRIAESAGAQKYATVSYEKPPARWTKPTPWPPEDTKTKDPQRLVPRSRANRRRCAGNRRETHC